MGVDMDEMTSDTVSVLYVEDDSSTRLQVAHLLKQHGYRCYVAENGQQGLELYRQHAPDIVLTDIRMPVMGGLEMARKIRADNPDVQLIVLTAFDERENMLAAIDIGVSQFVVKPVVSAKLIEAILHSVKLLNWKAHYQEAKHLEAVSILAGGMAHDFNNLLQVILGYIVLAKKNVEPGSKAIKYLDMIEPSSAQAIRLGQQLLTLTKLGFEGRNATRLTPLIESTLKAVLNDSQIICEIDIPPDLPCVTCDAGQIQQVIDHLAVNACEAMPQGGTLLVNAEVWKTTEHPELQLPAGDYLYFTFRDTGSGIAPENLRRIFEPYFSTKKMSSQKGEGLGLTVCHSIIHQHGGMLTARSKPGKGATFHLWLPVAAETVA